VAQQPPEPLLGPDLAHAGSVQRRALHGQPRGDLIGGQPLPPKLDHPAAGAILGWRHPGRWPRLARRGEQPQLPRPVLPHQVHHRPTGVAEPLRDLRIRQPLDMERAQCLVAAVVDLIGRGEPLRTLALW
jgi:hypothetical protein